MSTPTRVSPTHATPARAHVRLARPADAAALADVAAATFPDACPPTTSRAVIEAHIAAHLSAAVMAGWIADPGKVVLVGGAPEDPDVAAILGYAMLEVEPEPEPAVRARVGEARVGQLSKLYVLPAARGTGLAAALVHEGVARLRERGAAHVWLGTSEVNARANAFYARLGFERIGERTFVVGGSSVERDWVRMLTITD